MLAGSGQRIYSRLMPTAENRQLRADALLRDIAPMPQDVREAWLDELIAALRDDREREADRWLREAVELRRGALGLQELARQESPWRPQAWLDCLTVFARTLMRKAPVTWFPS